VLAPKGQAGDSVKYDFTFGWAKDYADMRDVSYEEGGFDVNVVPGMTVPTDLPVMFSLRTRNKHLEILPEYPDKTSVELAGEKAKDTFVCRCVVVVLRL
jgi:hypothetical protein